MRWPIASCFEEGKGELGPDHYELRFRRGWHHHMTLVILAHHFLVRLQQHLGPREGGHPAAGRRRAGALPRSAGGPGHAGARAPLAPQPGGGAPAAARRLAAARLQRHGGARLATLPATSQGRRISLPSQTRAAPPRSTRLAEVSLSY